jgi:hypothetical protein
MGGRYSWWAGSHRNFCTSREMALIPIEYQESLSESYEKEKMLLFLHGI